MADRKQVPEPDHTCGWSEFGALSEAYDAAVGCSIKTRTRHVIRLSFGAWIADPKEQADASQD